MNYDYFDIHSHLNFKDFDSDRAEIIEKMRELKIGTITVGVDMKTSEESIALAEKYEHLFATVGIHPTDVASVAPSEIEWAKFRELVKHLKVVAIGECGLDYFREKNAEVIEKQKSVFKRQIDIARKTNKSLMIHARPQKGTMDAYEDVLSILEDHPGLAATPPYQGGERGGHPHFHFYVGDKVITERALKLGATFSFDGPITFSNDYDDIIKMIPLERIMVETDSPFASPKSNRGKRNSPLFVPEIVARIAELKNLPIEQIKNALVANARRVFKVV